MKTSKLPRQLSKNASQYHKKVGELLSDPVFSGYKVRQEYPVKKVNPGFSSGREKFDWAVLDLRVVVEIMGQQHFSPVCFGGIDKEQALRNLRDTRARDENKRIAALEAGWGYVVLKFDEIKDLTVDKLIRIITFANIVSGPADLVKPKKTEKPRRKYNWPTGQKIPSRKFPKRIKNDN